MNLHSPPDLVGLGDTDGGSDAQGIAEAKPTATRRHTGRGHLLTLSQMQAMVALADAQGDTIFGTAALVNFEFMPRVQREGLQIEMKHPDEAVVLDSHRHSGLWVVQERSEERV